MLMAWQARRWMLSKAWRSISPPGQPGFLLWPRGLSGSMQESPEISNPLCTDRPSTRSRTIRNATSARASVPSLIYEEGQPSDASRPWVWRTDLSATKPFWENWFIGLSRKFLDARGGKLLLLAGTDRLDKELMIGQMQGMCSFYSSCSRTEIKLSLHPCRKISAASLPRSRSLHPGRPAGQDSTGAGGLLQAQ